MQFLVFLYIFITISRDWAPSSSQNKKWQRFIERKKTFTARRPVSTRGNICPPVPTREKPWPRHSEPNQATTLMIGLGPCLSRIQIHFRYFEKKKNEIWKFGLPILAFLYENVNFIDQIHAFFISTSKFQTSFTSAYVFTIFRLKWCLGGPKFD